MEVYQVSFVFIFYALTLLFLLACCAVFGLLASAFLMFVFRGVIVIYSAVLVLLMDLAYQDFLFTLS